MRRLSLLCPIAVGLVVGFAPACSAGPSSSAPAPEAMAVSEPAAPAAAPAAVACDQAAAVSALRALLYAPDKAELTVGATRVVRLPTPACAIDFNLGYPLAAEDGEDGEDEGDDEPPDYYPYGGPAIWVIGGDGARLADPVELGEHETIYTLATVEDFDGDGVDELAVEASLYGESHVSFMRWRDGEFATVLEIPLRTSPDGGGEEDGDVVCVASYRIGDPEPGTGRRLVRVERSTGSDSKIADPATSGCPRGVASVEVPQTAQE